MTIMLTFLLLIHYVTLWPWRWALDLERRLSSSQTLYRFLSKIEQSAAEL